MAPAGKIDGAAAEKQSKRSKNEDDRGLKFGTGVAYGDVYGAADDDDSEFVSTLPTEEEERKMFGDESVRAREQMEDLDEGRVSSHPSTMATKSVGKIGNREDDDPFKDAEGGSGLVNTRIKDRESDYQKRKHNRVLREDGLSFKESMQQANIEKERDELIREATKDVDQPVDNSQSKEAETGATSSGGRRRKRRWDQGGGAGANTEDPASTTAMVSDNESTASSIVKSKWDEDGPSNGSASFRRKRWDETPVVSSNIAATPLVGAGSVMATPAATSMSKWDETPVTISGAVGVHATPATIGQKPQNRWAETPAHLQAGAALGLQTPKGNIMVSGNLAKALSLEREMESRNRPWTDAALDAILPSEGYVVIRPPTSYIPLRTPGRKLLATPTPMAMTPQGFQMEIPVEQRQDVSVQDIREAYGVPLAPTSIETGDAGALPYIKPEDMQYFGRLMEDTEEEKLTKEEANERRIMALLLKIKNGTPPQRKTAMRQITDKARSFGAGPLFNQILPLLMSPTLEDQERHLLVKVIDRVLYKLDDLVRPYVHRILAVIEPLLIDEDYYARVEGREIISNLAKAAGLATMIATIRPDIDSPDEYVRNTTSRAVAVIASALGIPALLPFLKAVCQSRKSWQARHTGIKIVQQIALLMGVAILPYLRELVEIVSHGLTDDMQKVRIITALTCAALAEAAHPYGIESFDSVIRPLWKGALEHHGKALAAFLKAIGFIIPLMEENYASHYTRLVMPILLREFHAPDEEMKRIVLKVVQQCVATAGVEPDYIRKEILPEFFRNFWIRRMALDRRNYNQVIETTEELANKVGCSDIISRIVDDLKDDSEPYRRMVMETVKKVLDNLGAGDIDDRLEERLIDGILYAFQEQAVDASVSASSGLGRESQIMLDGFGAVVVALGERCKPYLKQIAGTIKWRLNNKAASVRMQAADLVARIAVVMKACNEDQLMGHLGVVLYEYLGEEYPEVLGSILGALRAIVSVIGMTKMTPPIQDLLPRLTPILRNRHEKVQENCIDLVGRIADRGPEFVSAKEWMRVVFEVIEMLRAHKKAIKRAAVSTFGFIAKAIGPQDVLHVLLNNLKVQDRNMRVCTTVAIAIVAETCGPFTVLPALMNEYRVPEINIQNGVLKAMSFMFEYIGDLGKDYVYAVTPLLEDALMDRDPVHRQTGCAAVKHLALGVANHGCEDALLHLLNFVWPNIFEESPHVIQAVFDAIQGLTVALGPNVILQYTLQGLYHPARKVREVYWRVFNTLYIYHADALVAGFPAVEDEGENTYARTSLELFI
ncbi:splicing factor 3B subunit 1 [Nitzschia inconspicua]|uniref:Splicing factor 3B subunit 1 n=1 Tax=Nitzschia inconspicua TaxID=303405 RepID=A0A9K3PYD5_9STRA|nr:splicing factor 3B subunit 1 [Nitzschia inconspicua]